MPILSARDQQAVRQRLDQEMKKKTRVTLFTRKVGGLFIPEQECRHCGETQQLLEELSALSGKLELDVRDFYADGDAAEEQGVERIPSILMGKEGQQNVRFSGIPAGYEFATLLDDVISISQESSPLSPPIRKRVRRITKDVRIQVFVTPT